MDVKFCACFLFGAMCVQWLKIPTDKQVDSHMNTNLSRSPHRVWNTRGRKISGTWGLNPQIGGKSEMIIKDIMGTYTSKNTIRLVGPSTMSEPMKQTSPIQTESKYWSHMVAGWNLWAKWGWNDINRLDFEIAVNNQLRRPTNFHNYPRRDNIWLSQSQSWQLLSKHCSAHYHLPHQSVQF